MSEPRAAETTAAPSTATTVGASTATRPRRADAERNRAAIIAAATAVFAEHGADVDVREIARRSGVGMGTLYRHFPSKEDLLRLSLEQEFTAWLTQAHERAAATPDPWQALSGFFEQALTTQAHNRALMDSYIQTGGPTESCVHKCRVFIDQLRERCEQAGVIRPGVSTEDLLALSGSLCNTVQIVGDEHRWRRLMTISLDGLSSRHLEPLPS
ncbi:TetR family transcriptional regulator [Kineosporia sp. NBRC 101677]|uniref:TetR/AcrR family transcriptional regulator n=1 Tax=Kineosporia sp. NBRC 101677 TaxID=3032197 RepID=UPI0024A45E5E|nr:TetR/AcrR family transcriptional regulator [Kineosporia sp. NBRC 101677]GLY19573.1 TetR family transcriptional regulator [Kineosporia sp. NBRC 101677]